MCCYSSYIIILSCNNIIGTRVFRSPYRDCNATFCHATVSTYVKVIKFESA